MNNCRCGAESRLPTHGGVIDIIYHIVKNAVWTNKGRLCKAYPCSLHIVNLDNLQLEIENFVAEKQIPSF